MNIVWLDLETTALEPVNGHIIEVGIIVTTPDLSTEIGRFERIIRPGDERGDSTAIIMHHNSHLLQVAKVSMNDRFDVFRDAAEFLHNCNAVNSPMCGANVANFDRRWLSMHAPAFESMFHYRNIDVSTFRAFATSIGFGAALPPKRDEHRALSDCEDALALGRFVAEVFRGRQSMAFPFRAPDAYASPEIG